MLNISEKQDTDWSKVKPFYEHFKLVKECDSLDEARKYGILYQSIIECIATKHPVYIRLPVEIVSDKCFEENRTVYLAVTRFSVGDCKKSGQPPGLIKISRAYDEGGYVSVTPFGIKADGDRS